MLSVRGFRENQYEQMKRVGFEVLTAVVMRIPSSGI
jgi:hypothetical protein